MNSPLVSVVVPLFNAEKWIAETLDSLCAQRHEDLQILVVDDGSKDRSAEIVEGYDDPRVRLIRQSNAGACAARNRGVAEAKGELLQFIDADDLLHADKIALQVERWQSLGDDYVYFGPYARFFGSIKSAQFRPTGNWADMSPEAWLVRAWSGDGMMAPHAWLVPRPLVEAAGPWNTDLRQNQDGEYFSRVLLASQGVRFCAGAQSYYRSGLAGSVSAGGSHAARASRLRAAEMISRRLLARVDTPEAREACANFFEEIMFVCYPQYPDLSYEAREWVQRLGGTRGLRPYRGRGFNMVASLLGWRSARRLQWWAKERKGTGAVKEYSV